MKKTEFPLSQIVKRLAELGLDENEISYSLGLTKRKFDVLIQQDDIAKALSAGEEHRARKVEDALYRRAVGFEYEEVVNAVTKPPVNPLSSSKGKRVNSSTREKDSLTKAVKSTAAASANASAAASEKSSAKSTIKTVIPDVTACIFWLKNRQADKWRDPKDITNGKKPIIEAIEDYDEEEK